MFDTGLVLRRGSGGDIGRWRCRAAALEAGDPVWRQAIPPGGDYAAAMTDLALPPIVVLGRDTCEDTIRSLALLVRRGIPFTYRKVDEDAAADAWIRALNEGRWRTPTIVVGEPDTPDAILREPSDEELLAALGLAGS
jgi:glutaredoxin